jgi:hypothetical protein
LLEGRWDYVPAGIHCITHLRFFTRGGIESLFAGAGLRIERCTATLAPPPAWFEVPASAGVLHIDGESLAAASYHIVARPALSAQ